MALGDITARLRRAPVIGTALAVQRRYGEDGGGNAAAAIAYYAFFSVFPLLLLAASTLGFALAVDPRLAAELQARVAESIPGLSALAGENLSALERGRAATGIVGLVGLLWSGTALVEASGRALSRICGRERHANMFKSKTSAIAITFVLGALLMLGVAVSALAAAAPFEGIAAVAVAVGGIAVSFAVDVLLFVTAYRLLIAGDGPPYRRLWPGAVLAAAGWTTLKLAGGWYGTRVMARSSAVYGTFAATIGLLVLLNLAARLLLYGLELNAELAKAEDAEGNDGGETGGENEDDHSNASHEGMEMKRESNVTSIGDRARGDGARSTPELVKAIATDAATLVRKEVELAKLEVTEAIGAKAKASASLVVAGVLAFVALLALCAALVAAIATAAPVWVAALVVGATFLALAGAAAGMGLRRLRQPSLAPEKTIETVKEDIEWAKAQLKR